MTALARACAEIEELGYAPRVLQAGVFPYALALIDYDVETGRYRGRRFRIGIGFQEDAYPEYPPHWICVASLPGGEVRQHSSFVHDGALWSVFSVPPSDFWDALPTARKNMKTYITRHVTRFWSQL